MLIGPSVFACNSGANDHVYGTALWNPAYSNSGALARILVSQGQCSNCSKWEYGGVHQELWEGTADTSFGNNWVEIGYTYGYEYKSGLTWFWADQRPGYSFNWHQITAGITVGDWYNMKIWDDSSNDTWYAAIDGTTYGASYPNASGSKWMQAGLEAMDGYQKLDNTYANQLQYRQSSTWYSSWSGAGLVCTPPAVSNWVTNETYYEVHDSINNS